MELISKSQVKENADVSFLCKESHNEFVPPKQSTKHSTFKL
jgi:hypothetical protein